MVNLAHDIDSGDESQPGTSYRISKPGEFSVIQSGKKYLVRKRGKKQLVETGRYVLRYTDFNPL
jgi:hypothetical protein